MIKIIKIFFSLIIISIILLDCTDKISNNSSQASKNQATYHEDFECEVYFHNTSIMTGLNIFIYGDGFIEEDMAYNGKYEKKTKEAIDFLCSIPPFSTYKSHFNAFIVYSYSNERGADSDPSIDDHDTIFGATYNGGGIQRCLVCAYEENIEIYFKIAKCQVLEKYGYNSNTDDFDSHINLMLVNDEGFGGSGGYYSTVSLYRDDIKPDYTVALVHEVGHSFANLADEYLSDDTPPSSLNYPNVDITNDLTQIRWNHFFTNDGTPIPGYEDVGAYEGAYYCTYGVWKPEQHSVMGGLYAVTTNFNAPSREAITKKIFEVLGWEYTFTIFLADDVIP